MSPVNYGKGAKAKATRLHSLIVRSRGVCARCGESDYGKLQCAHIIPRRYSATRTDEGAAWCLCARCHFRLTEHPDEHMHLVAQTIGLDVFDVLKQRALDGVQANKGFWESEAMRLTIAWKRIETAA